MFTQKDDRFSIARGTSPHQETYWAWLTWLHCLLAHKHKFTVFLWLLKAGKRMYFLACALECASFVGDYLFMRCCVAALCVKHEKAVLILSYKSTEDEAKYLIHGIRVKVQQLYGRKPKLSFKVGRALFLHRRIVISRWPKLSGLRLREAIFLSIIV